MKITYVHPNVMPVSTANTINVARMCGAMADAGHDVTLICRRGVSSDFHAYYGLRRNFRILAIPARRAPDRLFFLLALAYHRLRGGELFYTRNILAACLATSFGLPTVLELHTPPSVTKTNARRFSAAARRPALRRVLLNSPATLADAVALSANRENLCVLAPHGVDVEAPAPAPRDDPGPMRACYAGSFYVGRGVELLLEVARRTPEVKFRLVGANAAQKAQTEAQLHEAGVVNTTVFERVEPAQVEEILGSCDVCLAPYQREVYHEAGNLGPDSAQYMSPLKLFDYMPSGRAIVASDLPSISCIVEDGVSALLCDPDDPDSWATALRKLAKDPELRSRLSSAARTLAAEKYSWRARVATALERLG